MLKKYINSFEAIFTIFSLIHYSAGIIPLILMKGASEGDGTSLTSVNFALNQLGFVINYCITFCLIILRWKKVVFVLSKDRFLSLLVGVAVISCLWSVSPSMTIKEGISLILTTLFGLYFATRYTLKEQIKLLTWMFIIIVILSILFVVLPPRYGLMGGVHAGILRGIYTHKNGFGKMMSLGAIIFLIRAIDAKKHSFIPWMFFVISLIFLILARSTTALGTFAIMFILFFVYRTLRWRYEVMVPTTFAIATFGGGLLIWVLDNAESLANSIGKDTTLTGRTDFWPFLWEMVEKRPLFGYGFSAFWESNDAFYIWRAANWKVTDPHNGFLDLALALGALGVTVFFIGFLLNVLKAINLLHQSKTAEGLWPLLYLTNIIIANLTETSLLAGGFYWVLYATVSFSLLIPSEQIT